MRASRSVLLIILLVLLCDGSGFAQPGNAKAVKITVPANAAKVSRRVHIRISHSSAVTRLILNVDGIAIATEPLTLFNRHSSLLMADRSHPVSAPLYRSNRTPSVGQPHPPLLLTWDSTNTINGSHTISADAYGSSGQYLGRSSVRVKVSNTSPVLITAPLSGSTVEGMVSIATSTTRRVAAVDVYVDGQYLAASPPYTFTWNSMQMPNGSHTILANAYATNHILLGYDSVSVSVQNPLIAPTLSPTPDPTVTPTPDPTATSSPTPVPTAFPTVTPTSVPTVTPSPTQTSTPTLTPTVTSTPQPRATPSLTPTVTSTPTPTLTLTPVATKTPTPTPSETATPSATPTPKVLTTTLTLTSANNGQTFSNYRISTTSGDCVDMKGVTGVTFKNSDIGPCAGRGIYINGGGSNNIYDSYIHVEGASTGCCDTRDGIFLNGSNYDTVQGNVIAFSESNVEDFGNDNTIAGNFMLNPQGIFPRGQQIQTGNSATDTVISDNLLVSTSDSTLGPALGTDSTAPVLYSQGTTTSPPEDSINLYQSTNTLVDSNYVTGGLDATTPGSGGCQSPSGCGILGADYQTTSSTITGNIVVNTGQCGIGMGNGTDHVVTNNKVINLNPNSGGNTAIYIWNQYASACGPVLLSGNVATELRSSGYASGFWNGGGCAPVTCDGTNTAVSGCNNFDSGNGRTAYDALAADPAVITPPLIPPQPKNCVVNSPYSTQTSLPSCS